MIAFDTNYLVRHIIQDDAAQCKVVAAVLKREVEQDRQIRILDLVLLETAWVLESVYGFDRKEWSQVLEALLDDSAFSFDDPVRLRSALKAYRAGKADFADYLILGAATSESLQLKSFDRRLLKELR